MRAMIEATRKITCASGGLRFANPPYSPAPPQLRIPNLGIMIPAVGKKQKTPADPAAALFPQVQLRVLNLLIGQPEQKLSASEIIRLAGSGSGAVQRVLQKLAEAGILEATTLANRKLYQANRLSPIFPELHGLVAKTAGLIEPIRQALEHYRSKIDAAFIYGSVAQGRYRPRSGIDLMILGDDLTYAEIDAALDKVEKALSRTVHTNLITPSDWQRKLTVDNTFVRRLLQQPKLFVFGSEHALQGIR